MLVKSSGRCPFGCLRCTCRVELRSKRSQCWSDYTSRRVAKHAVHVDRMLNIPLLSDLSLPFCGIEYACSVQPWNGDAETLYLMPRLSFLKL